MLVCFATRQGATNRSLYKASHSLPSSQVDTCVLSMAHEVLHLCTASSHPSECVCSRSVCTRSHALTHPHSSPAPAPTTRSLLSAPKPLSTLPVFPPFHPTGLFSEDPVVSTSLSRLLHFTINFSSRFLLPLKLASQFFLPRSVALLPSRSLPAPAPQK